MEGTEELLMSLGKALFETFEMVGISTIAALSFGVPLGLILFVTSQGLFFENKTVNKVGGVIVNIIRSVPFVILLVLVLPFTEILVGTTIGPLAASFPLSIAAIAFYGRLAEGAFREIDKGVIEASIASGAKPRLIIREVLLIEALPGLLNALTITIISLIGYSAMAGIVGGGGVGDLAIRFGYYRYQTGIMLITVTVLVLLVQGTQALGDKFSRRFDRR
ncbi:MAG: methionine ABC transporter permease [Clostridiales bacterium GWB2_37_7]|nr:MAG: methionine ABC transporter permease [Clostridiales bacterium GWB2_37_7]